ncbi:unnamed protein product, partial [Heterosigma akashiwo]
DLYELDYHIYLPIFVDGLRERDDPYRFLAVQGTLDMVLVAPEKVRHGAPCSSRAGAAGDPADHPAAEGRAEHAPPGHHLPRPQGPAADGAAEPAGGRGAGALLPAAAARVQPVPRARREPRDGIAYNQRQRTNVAELIRETLEILEVHGGPDAFINIKYMIPT